MNSYNIYLCLFMSFKKSPSTHLSVLLHKVKFKTIKCTGSSNTKHSHLKLLKAYVNVL